MKNQLTNCCSSTVDGTPTTIKKKPHKSFLDVVSVDSVTHALSLLGFNQHSDSQLLPKAKSRLISSFTDGDDLREDMLTALDYFLC